jgi:GNAT superfamily N-acetyltransferase
MLVETKNNKKVALRLLHPNDLGDLSDYLQQLSPETKKRFGPHPFDKQSILEFYNSPGKYEGYVAIDMDEKKIIAYSVIKMGYLEHDRNRLESYGIKPDQNTDCSFAPSVADAWQGMGIGNKLLQFLISAIKANHINRIILWGGVQMDNEKAVNYYLKNGFKILGQFSYQGENYDMIFDIN